MGLDTTHDAFSGSYSSFNRFRQIVMKAAGGSFPPHAVPLTLSDGSVIIDPNDDRFYVPGKWSEFQEERPGISAFISSSDCGGSFKPKVCKQMADELEALLPEVERIATKEWGHILRDGGYVEVTKKYIAGCRLAHKNRQNLRYY